MRTEFLEQLKELVSEENFFRNEPMKKHVTFRTGGPAEVYLRPDAHKIKDVIRLCRAEGTPVTVIGNGSNLLVSDKGIPGVVIEVGRNMDQIEVRGGKMWIQAGALLSSAAKRAMEAGLSGMEFAAGIPGTAGGAAVMNAGAYDGEMKQILRRAEVLTPEGEQLMLEAEELELSYRHSCILQKGYLVLGIEVQLNVAPEGEKQEQIERIQAKTMDFKNRRSSKQPLEYPSAGSTFKRPEGNFAGKLIMEAGLAGYRVGGAMVSEKHCGFVINYDNAASQDIYRLIRDVQRIVKEKSGVELEPEVKFLGEFDEQK